MKDAGYVTKDSGQRENFDSGAVRDTRSGKGRYDLVSFLALGRIAGVYERGAAKYADRNWEQGIPISRNIDSALRHVAQYMLGEEDEDHLAQAAWNLIAALHFDEGIKRGYYSPELDDRPTYNKVPVLVPNVIWEGEKPMPEVQLSSTEQWGSQTVLHDSNHSESEGAWHYHDDAEGVAYPTVPADWKSKPHQHHRAA